MVARRVLVMGHVQPDGDCVSSALAICNYYRSLGTTAVFFTPEPLSPNLAWMLNEVPVSTVNLEKALEMMPDGLIVVDCRPTKIRTGFPIEDYMKEHLHCEIINIDHHADRLKEAPLPYENRIYKTIKTEVSSTAEILIQENNLNEPILYAGLATDTVFFRVGQIGSAMQAVLDLDIHDKTITKFRDKMDIKLTYRQMESLFRCNIEHYDESLKLMVISIPTVDGQLNVQLLGMTRGFDFLAIIQNNGSCSLRTTKEKVDLSKFAEDFDGGGHPQAAGCHINGKNYEPFISAFIGFARRSIAKEE